MLLSIVIPAQNEEKTLPLVLNEIKSALNSLPKETEVIVVDDHSSDHTAEIVKDYPFVTLVKNVSISGKGHALRAGFEVAKGKYIAMMDADFSHKAEDLVSLLKEVEQHNGLVVGSRITGGSQEYTRVRAFGNIVLTGLFGLVHGRFLTDALNGLKVFHGDVFRRFEYTSKDFEIEIELLVNTLRLKRPITELPSLERSRAGGKLKSMVVKHGSLFMFRILYERFRKARMRDS